MLKIIPTIVLNSILECLNQYLQGRPLELELRQHIIIPTHKNNDSIQGFRNYRPICLISCIAKLLEVVIKYRLEWMVESEAVLDTALLQWGYRKGINECTTSLVTKIHNKNTVFCYIYSKTATKVVHVRI